MFQPEGFGYGVVVYYPLVWPCQSLGSCGVLSGCANRSEGRRGRREVCALSLSRSKCIDFSSSQITFALYPPPDTSARISTARTVRRQ